MFNRTKEKRGVGVSCCVSRPRLTHCVSIVFWACFGVGSERWSLIQVAVYTLPHYHTHSLSQANKLATYCNAYYCTVCNIHWLLPRWEEVSLLFSLYVIFQLPRTTWAQASQQWRSWHCLLNIALKLPDFLSLTDFISLVSLSLSLYWKRCVAPLVSLSRSLSLSQFNSIQFKGFIGMGNMC